MSSIFVRAIFIIIAIVTSSTLAFNVDARDAVVTSLWIDASAISGPNENFAGYSFVTTKDESKIRIVAGAPSYAPDPTQPQNKNGAIVECHSYFHNDSMRDNKTTYGQDWITNSTCTVVVNDSLITIGDNQRQSADSIGVTLLMQNSSTDQYTVCAPGREKVCGSNNIYTPGSCYSGRLGNEMPLTTGWGEIPCFENYLDVIFLIDSSNSISNDDFNTMKAVLQGVLPVFSDSIGDTTQVGILQYGQLSFRNKTYLSSDPRHYYNPTKLGDCDTVDCLQIAIRDNMNHLTASNTYTARGIERAVKIDFANSKNKDIAVKILVLITDGDATDEELLDESYEITQANNVTVYAIGVGRVNRDLLAISANGDRNNFDRVLTSNNFNVLQTQLGQVTAQISTVSAEGTGSAANTLENAQVGLSGHFDEKSGELYFGVVGAYYGRGSIVEYKSTSAATAKVATSSQIESLLPRSNNSYFGYDVTSGYYDGPGIHWVAVGAPRYLFMGAVVAYESTNDDTLFSNSFTIDAKTHRQSGCYFGSSLLSTDINGDGKDDLFIGAPLYSGTNYDEGRVFVYVSQAAESVRAWSSTGYSPIVLFEDRLKGGRFGTAMTSAGDLNADGYNDVIIAAPYADDNRGVIFVYHGRSDGVDATNKQRIAASSSSSPGIRYFGLSLQGDIDLDGNLYPDIVVGAPKNDTVLVFRTRPVARLTGRIHFNVNSVDIFKCFKQINHECLMVEFCLTLDGKSVESAEVTYNITIDASLKRAEFRIQPDSFAGESTRTGNVNLTANNETCVSRSVFVKQKIDDFSSPITADVTYGLSQGHISRPLSPLTSPGAHNRATNTTRFEEDCGGDGICNHDLIISSSVALPSAAVTSQNGTTTDISNSGKTLVVASDTENEPIIFQVNLTNVGEHAYGSRISISFPYFLSWANVENTTSSNPSHANCINALQPVTTNGFLKTKDLIYTYDGSLNILPSGGWCKFQFKLSFNNLERIGSIGEFQIGIVAHTTSTPENEANMTDNSRNVSIPVRYRADARITRYRNIGEIPITFNFTDSTNKSVNSIAQIGENTTDVRIGYEVNSLGLANIPHSTIDLSFPSKLTPTHHLLYLYKVECTSTQGSAECFCDQSAVNTYDLSEKPTNEVGANASSIFISANPVVVNTDLFDCSVDGSTPEICDNLICNITNMQINDVVTIIATFRLWSQTLRFENITEVRLRSGFTFSTANSPYILDKDGRNSTMISLSMDTIAKEHIEARIPERQDQTWIYIVAAVGGLALLLVIVAIMYKVGFFKNQYYEMQQDYEWQEANGGTENFEFSNGMSDANNDVTCDEPIANDRKNDDGVIKSMDDVII